MQPTSTTTTTRTAVPTRKTHPIRGILWGILIGLGATVIAILLKIIPLDIAWAAMVFAGGIVVGILWSTLGPARKPKGAPPWRQTELTHRPDWDAAPKVSPVPPDPPGTEPLLIKPLDVEPVDIESPAVSDIPTSDAPVWDGPSERLPDPAQPVVDPVSDPPRTMGPPRTMDPPRAMDPPPPPPPPPPG